IELRDQDNPVLYAYAEQGDKTNASGNSKVDAGYVERHNPSDECERNIDKYEARVFYISEEDEKKNKNGNQTDGNHLRQAFRRAHLILEFTGPLNGIPLGYLYFFHDFAPRVGNRTTEI